MNGLEVDTQTDLIPPLLQNLMAVTIAILNPDGRLIACNKGFCTLIGMDPPAESIGDIRHLFISPVFADITAKQQQAGDSVYSGIMNIGHIDRQVSSIIANVYLRKGRYWLVGEYNVADLERLNVTVLELNEELADTQRELMRSNRELSRNERHLHAMMRTDSLTDIPNRRHFNERIVDEISCAHRYGTPLSLVICDIDHFKEVNDQFGHDAGDRVLQEICGALKINLRQSDFLARYGGEEFVLIFPETDLDEGERVAEKVREILAERISPLLGKPITASFGITELQKDDTLNSLLKRADKALYHSKDQGRNRLTRDDQLPCE